MRFTVNWLPTAIADLADVWSNAADRNAVTAAVDHIDLLLARTPLQLGESRMGTDRLVFEPPICVYYRVILDDLRVEVIGVGPA